MLSRSSACSVRVGVLVVLALAGGSCRSASDRDPDAALARGTAPSQEATAASAKKELYFEVSFPAQLLAEGLSTAELAARLNLSVNTVRNHVQSVLTRLDAHSKLEAVSIALREGIINPPDNRPRGSS